MTIADDDALSGRKRKHEEEYFRKQDQELIERMRRATAAAQARRDLADKTGLHDAAFLDELEALGFTPGTLQLLPLVPLVQVAWAEGGVSDAERKQIVALARARGIEPGSAADAQLDAWLAARPPEYMFSGATRLIRAMFAAQSSEMQDLDADDLVKYCESIAAASGGILGLRRVSPEERAALTEIANQLRAR